MTSPRQVDVVSIVLIVAALVAMGAVRVRVLQADQQKTIYVDQQIASTCSTYNVATRSCAGGTAAGYKTIAAAAAAATPGSTVLLRAGTYREPLIPPTSGTDTQPITFRNYEREAAIISDISEAPAIQLVGRAFIVIEGLTIRKSLGWGRIQESHDNVLRGMTFQEATATGTTGSIKIVRSWFNRIVDSTFVDGRDEIVLQDASAGNIISGNTFREGHHSLLSIRCANANVVRGNTFANELQKAIEIYDCEGVSDAPVRLDATKRNVIEDNHFGPIRGSWRPGQYDGIQHSGQYTIVRRNVFSHTLAGGVTFAFYAQEAWYVYGNRLYNNTFYENRCFALDGPDIHDIRFQDNRVVNNIFFKNGNCDGAGDQISVPDGSTVILTNNAMSLVDPQFVDAAHDDLRLAPTSPYIDKGVALTTTVGAGEGTTMKVNDPMYFYDGFKIPGEKGDEIQLMGTANTARVTAIDYKAKTLTLDRPLTWAARQGIALKYAGAAPDLGAYELGAPAPQPPKPAKQP